MTNFLIGGLRPDDRARGWDSCFSGYCAFYESPCSELLMERVFALLLDPAVNLTCIVARSCNGEVIGIAQFRRAPSSLDGRNMTFLDDLFTLPEERGKGVARALIGAVHAEATAKGELPVHWLTADTNVQAQILYDMVARRTSWYPYAVRLESASSPKDNVPALPEGYSLFSCEAVTPDDEASWTEIFSQYAAFYNCPVTDEILATTFGWFLDPTCVVRGLFVKDSLGAIVGLCHFRPRVRSMSGGSVGYIDDLFVHAEHRGKGIAETLLRSVLQYGREKGWPRVHWITASTNEPAQRLYERCGATRQPFILYEME